MRARTWIFTALVAVLFAVNLALVSTRIAQTGEDTVRERLLQASTALHAQLELIDARLSPKSAAEVPELADATKPASTDPAQPPPRPDDRALRAAASALAPEPDLLAVFNAQGALVSRRARPVESVADIGQLPLAKAALERSPLPSFVTYEGTAYRMAAARVPGSAAAVLAGTAADDRLAAQLKTQVDADVTLIASGKVVASSLPAEARDRVSRWAAAPGPGFGVLQVVLPGVGNALSGRLPRGASRYAVRGTLVPLDGEMEAALTVPASPYIGWLARYQAFSLLALALLVLFGFFWGLFSREPARMVAVSSAPPEPRPVRRPRAVVGTDAAEGRSGAGRPMGDVPWTNAAAANAVPEPAVVVGDVAEPAGPTWDGAEKGASAGTRAVREDAAAASEPSPERLVSEPAESAVQEPGVPERAVSEPALSDRAEPGLSERAEPALSDAALAEPAPAAPAFSNPALSEPGPAAASAGPSGKTSDTSAALANEDEDEHVSGREQPARPAAPESAPAAVSERAPQSSPKTDFSFAGLLDDAAAPVPLPGPALPIRQGEAEWAAVVDAGHRPAADEAAQPATADDAARQPEPAGWGDDTARPSAAEESPKPSATEAADAWPAAAAQPAVASPEHPGFEMVAPSPDLESAATAVLAPNPSAESAYLEAEPASPTTIEREYLHRPDAESPRPRPPFPASETASTEAAPSETAPGETAPNEIAPTEPATAEAAGTESAAAESAVAEPQADPDEAHWRETYDRFIALREQLGEPGRISYERFAAKLAKNREDLMARRQCSGVRFSVYEKDGRASIKASAVR